MPGRGLAWEPGCGSPCQREARDLGARKTVCGSVTVVVAHMVGGDVMPRRIVDPRRVWLATTPSGLDLGLGLRGKLHLRRCPHLSRRRWCPRGNQSLQAGQVWGLGQECGFGLVSKQCLQLRDGLGRSSFCASKGGEQL